MKLRLIADHPRISSRVKAICYSGKMLPDAHLCKNIHDWFGNFVGEGFKFRYPFRDWGYFQSLTPEELEVHYQKFWAHHHSEQLMQKYDIETQDLTSVIAKLPQLDEVCFARGEHHIVPIEGSFSLEQLSSVARETLIESVWYGGLQFHVGQFTALLKAAHIVQRPLHTIKALGVPWRVFQQSNEVVGMMVSATRACRHLTIESFLVGDRQNGKANLAKLILSSSHLHTLNVSFYCDSPEYHPKWMMMLSELFEAGAHWPNLKRLKLRAIKATDTSLMSLLTTHAKSLRFLGSCKNLPPKLSIRWKEAS